MGDNDLLNHIKERWPQFPITKENLLRPTKELVLRFYSNFMNECHEKIAYLTRCEVSDVITSDDLSPDDRLFQQLSRLLGRIHSLTFTLLDIYQPTHKGTKIFFRICIHFIRFIDYSVNEIDILGNNVFTVKEEIVKYSTELQELLEEINENCKTKAELAEYNKNTLEQECKAMKILYKEMQDLKAAKEKSYAEKKMQIDNLMWECENEESELNRMKVREEELQKQRITASEYQNILHNLESLKADSELLERDDLNIEDGLVLENEALTHSAECNRVLSKCDINLQIVKTLISKEEELKIFSNTIEKLLTDHLKIKEQKQKSEHSLLNMKEQFVTLQNEYEIIKENYITNMKKFANELAEIRSDSEQKAQNNVKEITEYKEAIIKLEGDLEKLRKSFIDEYVRLSNAEKRVIDKFKEAVVKYGRSE